MLFASVLEPDDVTNKLFASKLSEYMITALPRLVMTASDAEYNTQKEKIISDITGMDGYQAFMKYEIDKIQKAADFCNQY